MTEINKRRLPVGLQSFKEIRRRECLYVDKTDIIWRLVNEGIVFNYFIRPRRFGKSVLVDTLQAYFEGKKEPFEGLKIMDMEKENGGLAAAEAQIKANNYAEPFKADKRKVIALAIELDDIGKGLIDLKEVE